jgi:hypothetical protein
MEHTIRTAQNRLMSIVPISFLSDKHILFCCECRDLARTRITPSRDYKAGWPGRSLRYDSQTRRTQTGGIPFRRSRSRY